MSDLPGASTSVTDQAIADLLWVVNSPSFVCGADVAPQQSLAAADVDSDALASFLGSEPPHRVGRYFEELVHFWLKEVRHLDVIGAGIQVLDGKRTIGEVDFIYRDEGGALTHCEAAAKFFLHHPREHGSHFPGPNAADDYERKTTKLFEQQLQLSREHFPDVVQRHAFMKGMLFTRAGSAGPAQLPQRMPADHGRGTWMRWQDLVASQDRTDTMVCVVRKPYWLAPEVEALPMRWTALCANLAPHFAQQGHPIMLSIRDGTTTNEISRMFVVADQWPSSAAVG